MSAPAANCPSCGAPITFTWSMAVQTVCAYCRSVVVRHGVELEALGKASDPPADRSPIQVGTRGRFGDAHFRVTGRIVYEYERGRWNEWHLELADGRTAWLTDSEAQYAVTFAAEATPLPPLSFFRPGRELTVLGTEYTVRERIQARWVAVEGELPFASFDAGEVALVDLVTAGRECATIDFGGETARAFTGAYVEFDDLALTGLRDLPQGAAAGEVRALNCPGCGGSVEVRTAASVNVVCRHCQRVLDAAHPGLRVLRKFEAGHAAKLHIPIGTRGRLHGVEWEVVGFQVRSVKEEGIAYPWHEYLLFNPRRGFRYLTYENGHWNDEVPLHGAPRSGHASVRYEGRKYRHFASAKATTTWVAGEFPWQVTATDREMVSDYVSPPFSLSSEGTEKERSWTLGEFITGARVWEAFRLPGKPPLPIGIAPNQPFTGGAATAQLWKGFAAFAVLCLVALLVRLGAQGPEVARQTFAHTPSAADLAAENGPAGAVSLRPADAPPTPLIPARAEAPAEPAAPADSGEVVVGPFVVTGRPSNLEVRVSTDVENMWAFFDVALVNDSTGETIRFSDEVAYYHGYDDGPWSEGSTKTRWRLPSVPAGRYHLEVAAESNAPVRYTVSVRRDVAPIGFYFMAVLLLLVPPAIRGLFHGSFEMNRWSQSDHPIELDLGD